MKKNMCIFALVALNVAMILVYFYVRNESPIYVYDYSGYHQMYIQYAEKLIASKSLFYNDFVETVKTLDYNASPILAIIPFYFLFKAERFGYILALVIMYVVPAIILTAILMKKFIFKDKELEKTDRFFVIVASIISFLFTRYWAPTLRGLPDIVGVIPMAISGFIFLKHSFIEKNKFYIPVILGIMVYSEFMLRRWYAYSVVAFVITLFIIELIRFIKTKKSEKKEKFINAFKNFSIMGASMLACGCIFQLPLIKRIITENYSSSYSAFQVEVFEHFTSFVSEFGWVVVILAIIGGIWCIKNKEHRYNGLFLILNVVICHYAFTRVQAMGVHHFLSISLWMIILAVYGVYAIYNLIKNKYFKVAFLCIITLFFGINFITTFLNRDLSIKFISQNSKYCKFYYENFSELQRLINDLDVLVTENGGKITAFSDSDVISDNIIDLLGSQTIKNNICYTSHIDLRDGLNFNGLMCEYVVITDVPQLGVNPNGQRIVSIPNNEILNGSSIGKAYSKVSGPYTLDNNVNAFIYKKERAFSIEEVNEYMEMLYEYYPQWREQYNEFDILSLSSNRELGKQLGDVRRYTYDTIYMSPGFNETTYSIPIDGKVKKIDLKAYIDGNINTNDETCGSVGLTIKDEDQVFYQGVVKYKEDNNITLDLENTEQLDIIVDDAQYLNCDWLFLQIVNVEI